MWKEFKEFAFKGNVIDMAVGVIIGGAFGKIISSLVADIIMPAVGFLIGGLDFTQYKILLGTTTAADGAITEVAINYGVFIQTFVDFLIVAFCIFLCVKAMNKAKRKTEEAPAEPAAPTEAELLTEIRDLLKTK